jgi:predicted aconitase
MKLTDDEKKMLQGEYGPIRAQALDRLVQFGDAFGAEKLVPISYCHYPAEMAIYDGFCEDVEEFANQTIQVVVPTTSSTLCCDMENPTLTNCPKQLFETQRKTKLAFQKMDILETYTCTPQQIGFVPPMGSYISSVESSAIIYFNSLLGAKTNRGGLFTRYSSITGKYPAMGYLLDENRTPTCFFDVSLEAKYLSRIDQWSILGYIIGEKAQDQVPYICHSDPKQPTMSQMISFGAAMATSGSVTLFHMEGVTPEAKIYKELHKTSSNRVLLSYHEIENAQQRFQMIHENQPIDFVVLGCPHANLELIRYVVEKMESKTIHADVTFWICTNRMTKLQASHCGYVDKLHKSGIKVVADTCPVESHMRKNICDQYNLPYPCFSTMLSNSLKMLHYSRNLLGVKTALLSTHQCIESAVKGKRVPLHSQKEDDYEVF